VSGTPPWEWLGHFCVRVFAGGATVYLDPFRLRRRIVPADLVLLTNPRLGHTSPEDLARVCGPDTRVAGPEEAVAGLPYVTLGLKPGEEWSYHGIRLRAIPAYTRETVFFPRDRDWLGYLLRAEGLTIYHAGATDLVPEMENVSADVAFLPVSGRYVMGPEDARRAADRVGAGTRVGLFLAGDRFTEIPGFVTRYGRGSPRS
jgi:L-ascorbate metabolism protein UlaG (beta-lactamase superfamily)